MVSNLPTRKPNRLKGYDYSQNGAYFVTICTRNRAEIFGKIVANHSETVGNGLARPDIARPTPKTTAAILGNIAGGYKSGVSRLCGNQLWQRSFHDHIIRNERELIRIVKYIENNPNKWIADTNAAALKNKN